MASWLKMSPICGIIASLLFVGTDVLAVKLWPGYNPVAQSISELSAPGAPTRSLVVSLNLVYYALMLAFSLGVWRLSGEERALRVTAGLLVAKVAIDLVAVFFPMHPGEPVSSSANTANVLLGALGMVLFLLTIAFGAAAFQGWFRWYSIGTLLAYLVLTVVGIWVIPRVAGPAPRIGAQERVMVAGYLLWVVVLAVVLLRSGSAAPVPKT